MTERLTSSRWAGLTVDELELLAWALSMAPPGRDDDPSMPLGAALSRELDVELGQRHAEPNRRVEPG